MSQASGSQAVPPPKEPNIPHVPGGEEQGKLSYKMGLGALFIALFQAVAGLYRTITTGDLQTLNQQLNRETEHLTEVGSRIAQARCSYCLAELKNQQQQIQTQISSLNVSMNTMTSASASLATMLGKVVDTQKALLVGVTSNW